MVYRRVRRPPLALAVKTLQVLHLPIRSTRSACPSERRVVCESLLASRENLRRLIFSFDFGFRL